MHDARLIYLYVGSTDVEADLSLYVDRLGGEVVWRVSSGGAEVAAVRLGEGPLVLLADHRPPTSTIQIWAVPSLDEEVERMTAAGWSANGHTVEVPDGPCLILADASGNEIGLLEEVRPGLMEGRWRGGDDG
jgi:hypothetical protein